MARILSQTLIRGPQTLIRDPTSPCLLLSGARRSSPSFLPPPSRLLSIRGSSGRPDRPPEGELIEVDLAAGSDDSGDGEGEVEVIGLRRLEDAIHGLIIRRAAPCWLPFVPGASYWVPPRKKAYGVVELVGKLANPLTEEEELSFTTIRGWPSSAYFVKGVSPHPVKKSRKKAAGQSDDEE